MFNLFRSIRFMSLFIILTGLVWIPQAQAQADNFGGVTAYIDIGQGSGRKYNIAIADLVPLSGSTDRNATYLPTRLGANLEMTGLFRRLDNRSSLESNVRGGVDGSPVDFDPWKAIGADYLVKGGMTLSGSKITLEMRLFDVAMGNQMLGKRYSGPTKDARKMINQFTNAVLEAITGTPGVFGSEIIFVSGDMSQKSIMMTELGSDEATQLAGHKGGPSTQPTLGPGGKTAWVHRNGKKWELLVNGKVVSSGDLHLSPAFKPDGTVAAAVSGPTSTAIHAFSGRSKTPLVNAGGINVSPTFSPDGSQMAFVSNQSGTAQIYVAPASGGAGTRLTNTGKSTDPAWSPTGEYIAFVTRETDICIIRPDGTGLRQLTGGQGSNMRPSFSPDGRMIVFSSTRNGRSQLFVMSANGDSQQPLMPDYSPHQEQPYWSPTMLDSK
ncbi:hypothetical protein C4J81_09825 [Deltaproteobacteria bacterium Smac51]|nr:hypothetical protein C4J81_09825 [Deltaproteobacteria bacterium Smac51]